MMPRFSQEITDQVIDHLHDDKPALSACALVHRSWLPAARLHIFEKIELVDDRDMDEIDAVVDMLSRSPGVALSVQSLTIARRMILPKSFSVRALKCLVYLISLHELTLEDNFCFAWSEEEISGFFNCLSARSDTIRSLSLRHVMLCDLIDVAYILEYVPLLRNLCLSHVITLDRPSAFARYVADVPRPIPRLTVLSLEDPSPTFKITSLLLEPALFTLKVASLEFAGETSNLPTLLDRIGLDLKDLTLRFIPSHIPKPSLAQDIARTLSKCESISKFTFKYHGGRPASCLKFLSALLQALPGGTLEDVTIFFHVYNSPRRAPRPTDWGIIDILLSDHARFGILRRVAVDVSGTAAEFTNNITALSTGLVDRGLLVAGGIACL